MKIAIAPNAFKGSLTAFEAAACIERGLRKALRDVSFVRIPMADGGDGTLLSAAARTRVRPGGLEEARFLGARAPAGKKE